MNWLSILEYYKSMNRTGPTVPFLIGAEEFKTGFKPTIYQLLKEFSESSIPIYLANCTTIDALVITLNQRMINISKSIKIDNLTVQAKELNWIKSLEDLKNHLDFLYSEKLDNSEYSRINGDWEKLSKDDEILINKAVNKYLA